MVKDGVRDARPDKLFDGSNVIDFHVQMALFDANNASSILTDKDKLMELTYYFSGPPYKTIKSFLIRQNEPGIFEECREELYRHYASTPESAWSYLENLRKGKPLGEDDVAALDEFRSDLVMTHALAKSAGKEAEIDRTDRLKELVEIRLPFMFRSFGQRLHDLRSSRREFTFSTLIDMVSEAVAVARICGKTSKLKISPKIAAVDADSAFSSDPCGVCDSASHPVARCPQLRNLDGAARSKKLSDCGVCTKCAKKTTHLPKDCIVVPFCEIFQGRHLSICHVVPSVPRSDRGKNHAAPAKNVGTAPTPRAPVATSSSPVRAHAPPVVPLMPSAPPSGAASTSGGGTTL